MKNSFYIVCLLATFTVSRAQVFKQIRYIEMQPGRDLNVTNAEYPDGYARGTASQTKIRGPMFYQIAMKCQVVVGTDPGDCTDWNGVMIQLDGTPYLNTSNAYQICNSRQTYTFTSKYNTVIIGHYSTPDENAKSGAWFCTMRLIQKACDCGWAKRTRIVGGTFSQPNAHPSLVALLDTNNNLLGAGTIIGDKAILTAAHTISDGNGGIRDLSYYRVSSSRDDIRLPFYEDTIYSENYRVTGYSILSGYDEANDRNDMAILYTDQFIAVSDGCGPICLPNPQLSREDLDYLTALIVGFGAQSFGGPYSYKKKEASVTIRPKENCAPFVEDTKICAQSAGTNKSDACQGDSGGPLYYFDPNIGRYRLIGVISGGENCGSVGYYETVSLRMGYIMRNLQTACLYP